MSPVGIFWLLAAVLVVGIALQLWLRSVVKRRTSLDYCDGCRCVLTLGHGVVRMDAGKYLRLCPPCDHIHQRVLRTYGQDGGPR